MFNRLKTLACLNIASILISIIAPLSTIPVAYASTVYDVAYNPIAEKGPIYYDNGNELPVNSLGFFLIAPDTAGPASWSYEILQSDMQSYDPQRMPSPDAAARVRFPSEITDGVNVGQPYDPGTMWVLTFDDPINIGDYLLIDDGENPVVQFEITGSYDSLDGVLNVTPMDSTYLEEASGYAGGAVVTLAPSSEYPSIDPTQWNVELLDEMYSVMPIGATRISDFCSSPGVKTSIKESGSGCPFDAEGNRVYAIEFGDMGPNTNSILRITDQNLDTWDIEFSSNFDTAYVYDSDSDEVLDSYVVSNYFYQENIGSYMFNVEANCAESCEYYSAVASMSQLDGENAWIISFEGQLTPPAIGDSLTITEMMDIKTVAITEEMAAPVVPSTNPYPDGMNGVELSKTVRNALLMVLDTPDTVGPETWVYEVLDNAQSSYDPLLSPDPVDFGDALYNKIFLTDGDGVIDVSSQLGDDPGTDWYINFTEGAVITIDDYLSINNGGETNIVPIWWMGGDTEVSNLSTVFPIPFEYYPNSLGVLETEGTDLSTWTFELLESDGVTPVEGQGEFSLIPYSSVEGGGWYDDSGDAALGRTLYILSFDIWPNSGQKLLVTNGEGDTVVDISQNISSVYLENLTGDSELDTTFEQYVLSGMNPYSWMYELYDSDRLTSVTSTAYPLTLMPPNKYTFEFDTVPEAYQFLSVYDGYSTELYRLNEPSASGGATPTVAPTASFDSMSSLLVSGIPTYTGIIPIYTANCESGCNFYVSNSETVGPGDYLADPMYEIQVGDFYNIGSWSTGTYYIKVYDTSDSLYSDTLILNLYSDLEIAFDGDPESIGLGDGVQVNVTMDVGSNCEVNGCNYYLSDTAGVSSSNWISDNPSIQGSFSTFATDALTPGNTYYIKAYDPTSDVWSNEISFTLQEASVAPTASFADGTPLADTTVTVGDTVEVYLVDGDCSEGCEYTLYDASNDQEIYRGGYYEWTPMTYDTNMSPFAGNYYIEVYHYSSASTLDPIYLTVEDLPAPTATFADDDSLLTDKTVSLGDIVDIYFIDGDCNDGCDYTVHNVSDDGAVYSESEIYSSYISFDTNIPYVSGNFYIEIYHYNSSTYLDPIYLTVEAAPLPEATFADDNSLLTDTTASFGDIVDIYLIDDDCSNGCSYEVYRVLDDEIMYYGSTTYNSYLTLDTSELSSDSYYISIFYDDLAEYLNPIYLTVEAPPAPTATFDQNEESVVTDTTVTVDDYLYIYFIDGDCNDGCDYTVYDASNDEVIYSEGGFDSYPLYYDTSMYSFAGDYYIEIYHSSSDTTLSPLYFTVEELSIPEATFASDNSLLTDITASFGDIVDIYIVDGDCNNGCSYEVYRVSDDGYMLFGPTEYVNSLALDTSELSAGSYYVNIYDDESGYTLDPIYLTVEEAAPAEIPEATFASDNSLLTSMSASSGDTVNVYIVDDDCSFGCSYEIYLASDDRLMAFGPTVNDSFLSLDISALLPENYYVSVYHTLSGEYLDPIYLTVQDPEVEDMELAFDDESVQTTVVWDDSDYLTIDMPVECESGSGCRLYVNRVSGGLGDSVTVDDSENYYTSFDTANVDLYDLEILQLKQGLVGIMANNLDTGAYSNIIEVEVDSAFSGLDEVTLADEDYDEPGVSGSDFTISWNPITNIDSAYNFEKYELYVIDSRTLDLNGASFTPDNYNFTPLATFYDQARDRYQLPPHLTLDSGSGLSADPADTDRQEFSGGGAYIACVYAVASGYSNFNFGTLDSPNQLMCGNIDSRRNVFSTMVPVSDISENDFEAPFIMHEPSRKAIVNRNAYFYAIYRDNQTTAADVLAARVGESQNFTLYYRPDGEVNYLEATRNYVEGGLFEFVVPSSAVVTGFDYYLEAVDSEGGSSAMCASQYMTPAMCQTLPFHVSAVAQGSLRLSGTVSNSSTLAPLSEAYVIPSGYAISAQSLAETGGTYSFTTIPQQTQMHAMFYGDGYCDIMIPQYMGSTSVSGVDFYVQPGACLAGDPVFPENSWPFPGMGEFPIDGQIMVMMSEPLDRGSVENNVALDSESSIYLRDVDEDERVDGEILYCQNNSAIGQNPACALLPSDIYNAVVFWPSSDLDPDHTFYEFVINGGVIGESGRPIEGNSADGTGYELNFWTSGGDKSDDIALCGTSPEYQPISREGYYPYEGDFVPSGVIPTITFDGTLNSSTVSSTNVKLFNIDTNEYVPITASVSQSLDQIKFISDETLQEGSYRMELWGGIAGTDGLPYKCESNNSVRVMSKQFNVMSNSDGYTEFPQIDPPFDNNASNVPVSIPLTFYVNGALDFSTINEQNVSLYRGSKKVSTEVFYEPYSNSIVIKPINRVLNPGENYSAIFSTSLADVSGNNPEEDIVYSFSTSSETDSTAPKIVNGLSWCSINNCFIQFSKVMNETITQTNAERYASSVMVPGNYVLTVEDSPGSGNMVVRELATSTSVRSDVFIPGLYIIEGMGLSSTDAGRKFSLRAANVADTSDNTIDSNANSFTGVFDGFDTAGDETMKFETPDDFDSVIQPMPSNPYAGEGTGDYFQVFIDVGVLAGYAVDEENYSIEDGDQLRFTFPFVPNNTKESADVSVAIPDYYSPFYNDFAPDSNVTIHFEDSNEISVDADSRQITVNLSVEGGEITDGDNLFIDLRDIVNPSTAKKDSYKIYVEHLRDGELMTTKSVPSETYDVYGNDGSNSFEVRIFAGSADNPTVGADGFVDYVGKQDKSMNNDYEYIELVDGQIANINGESATSLYYDNLPNGCYGASIPSFVELGGQTYVASDLVANAGSSTNFGINDAYYDVCVFDGEAATKDFVYLPVDGGLDVGVANLTVKIDGTFNSAPLDIIMSPPQGAPIVQQLKSVTTPSIDGYDLSIPLVPGTSGRWDVELAPGFLNERNPMPAWNLFDSYVAERVPFFVNSDGEIEEREVFSPYGKNCSESGLFDFDETTSTITFSAERGEIAVPVEIVNSAGEAIAASGIEIFAWGGCGHTAAVTGAGGTATLYLNEFGSFGIDANYQWFHNNREIKVRKDENGAVEGVYFAGQKVISYVDGVPTGSLRIPLDIDGTLVSGEIRNSSGQKITGTPFTVTAYESTTGRWIDKWAQETNGTWSIMLPFDGEWTVKLKPNGSSSTDTCGSFTKTITIAGESAVNNQHIQQNTNGSTCHHITGTVEIPGITVNKGNVYAGQVDPVTLEKLPNGYEIDTPIANGGFNMDLLEGTYWIGFWSEGFDYGETVVVDEDKSITLSPGAVGGVNFEFVGGSANIDAFVNLRSETQDYGNHINSTVDDYQVQVPEGTYDYFLDVNCMGQFEGTASTGDTVVIDISGIEMATLSGTVYDGDGIGLNETFVDAQNFEQRVHCSARTDDDGNYSMIIRKGSYWVNAFKEQYIMHDETVSQLTLNASVSDYDFGGSETAPRSGLVEADRMITVTLYEDDGTTPIVNAGVNATSTGFSQPAIPNDDGTFVIYVVDGDWDIEVFAPGYMPLEGETAESVTVDGADENVTITMPGDLKDSTRASLVYAESVSATTGKSINKMDEMGMSVKFEPGFMTEDAVVTMKRDFVAKKTSSHEPVCGLTYDVSIVTDDGLPQTTFLKPITITLKYDPDCISMQLLENIDTLASAGYYDESIQGWRLTSNTYINTDNSTITFTTSHLTEFAVVTPPEDSEEVTGGDDAGGDAAGGDAGDDTVNTGGSRGHSYTSSGAVVTYFNDPNSDNEVVEEVTSVANEVVDDEYDVPKGGEFEENLSVKNSDTDAYVTIFAGTKITDDSGKEFEGILMAPTSVKMDVNAPESKYEIVSKVYEIGDDSKSLSFDQKIKVVLPLDEDVDTNYALAIYSYNEQEEKWEYEGTGTIKSMNGDYVVEFEVKHLTKFAVFSDTSTQLNTSSNVFKDVGTHWAKNYIEFLYSKGIISGYTDGTFGPDDSVTRAQFTKIAVEAFDIEMEDGVFTTFKDVSSDDWFAKYVETAYVNEIVKGYDDGTFRPDAPITRAEAMKVLMTTAGIDVSGASSEGFNDVPDDVWYAPYINYAKSIDIVGGYGNGTFGPQNHLRRGEVAKIVSLLLVKDAGSAVGTALETSL